MLTVVVLLWQAGAVESEIFDLRGVSIRYLVDGAGELVVLIHGLSSSARINWELPGTRAALAADHRVVTLDLPEFGRSGKPASADAYGLRWIEDIARLLDQGKIGKAHIVGYSMGGIVSLKFIAEDPDRVLSGTLGGMGWLPQGGGLQKIWASFQI